MKKISYETYTDKVRGCFAGKAVAGTLGAPYEGVKMQMALKYRKEMTDAMLPNDDLDLQVLWLDVLEKKGAGFTSYDLQKRFCEYCDYSPGEYAVMRKNHEYGIYPPYSGSFNNDFYKEGMGCPIRSEIWACVAPGDPTLAAEFASRDGVLDHAGESVYAERFFAALECEAFFDADIRSLIKKALIVIPADCKFRGLVNDTVNLCDKYGDIRAVRAHLLDKYGHPDCTNMFQNMGITLASLLLGELDLIKTAMTALNCGFDTDCTCASAGSVVGLILGEKELKKILGVTDLKYVLSVRSDRRSDLIADLADDIAALGVEFSRTVNKETKIEDAPDFKFDFDKKPVVKFSVDYRSEPAVSPLSPCLFDLTVKGEKKLEGVLRIECPDHLYMRKYFYFNGTQNEVTLPLQAAMADVKEYTKKNIIKAVFDSEDGRYEYEFGMCADDVWRVDGPFWRTDPAVGETELEGGKSYWSLLHPASDECGMVDGVREFHLNFAVDAVTEYADPETLFKPFSPGYNGKTVSKYFYRRFDTFDISDFSGFSGPSVFYMSQIITSPSERDAYLQIGRTSPVTVWWNGEKIGERKDCTTFTKENVHLKVHFNKGENRLVLRLTKANADAKFSVIFSKGATCADHLTDLGYKKI